MIDESDRAPFKSGDGFLQYTIHSLLGRGGHAYVYAGQHRYMERPVAIKVIPAPPEMNSEVYHRARLEAKILSQLEHPNVVKIYDAGVTDEGAIYIVMEMLKGRTVRDCLKKLGQFTVPETFHVGIQIAEAVQVAHAQNAIHRDLKPENVFILPGNVIKVLDFGITKLLGANAMTTQPNIIRGTPQYMSPEHMEGRLVTAQSDIYALGSVLYELLAAIPPALIGLQEITSYAIGYSQIHRMPPLLDEVAKHVPRYVAQIIQRMIAKEPKERPASMAEVATELRALESRFVAESLAERGEVRDLWQATRKLAAGAESHDVHSASTAIGNVVLTDQVTAAVASLNSNAPGGTVPLPPFARATEEPRNLGAEVPPLTGGAPERASAAESFVDPQLAVARAERLIARRMGANRSPSGPVPVSVSSRPPREAVFSYRYLAGAIALGVALGCGAIVVLRLSNAAPVVKRLSNAVPTISSSPKVDSTANHSKVSVASSEPQIILPPARINLDTGPELSASAPASPKGPSGVTQAPPLGNARSATKPEPNTPASVAASAASAQMVWLEPASTKPTVSAGAPKTATIAAPTPKPSASNNGAVKAPKNKDKLIFGADDLNW